MLHVKGDAGKKNAASGYMSSCEKTNGKQVIPSLRTSTREKASTMGGEL